MAIQDTTGYIRVKHTGLIPGKLYLKDLDGEANRGNDRQKVPCYVGAGNSIDIMLTDRTLASFRQGDIAGFVKKGYLEAFLVRDLQTGSYEEITYDSLDRPLTGTTWTDSTKTSKIEERQWTYTGSLVTSELKLQYDKNQTIAGKVLFTYTYDGSRVVSIKEELVP